MLVTIVIATFVSVGYSYWNSTLHITGTATIVGNSGGGSGSGTQTDPYIVPETSYDPGDASNQDDGYYNYTDAEGSPVVEVENGEVVSYTLTETEGGADVVGVDTGVKPFDGSSSFTIHIEFYATFSQETSYDRVVSVIQDTGTGNSHSYSGFNLFYYYSSRGGNNTARYLRTQSFSNKSSLSGQNMSSGSNLRKVDTTITSYYTARTKYTFDITYTNSNAQVSVTSSINDGTAQIQTFTSDVTNLSQATVHIGCNGINSSENVESLEVIAFSVVKN